MKEKWKKRRDEKAIITGGGERKYERQALEHTDTQNCPDRWHHASYLGPKKRSIWWDDGLYSSSWKYVLRMSKTSWSHMDCFYEKLESVRVIFSPIEALKLVLVSFRILPELLKARGYSPSLIVDFRTVIHPLDFLHSSLRRFVSLVGRFSSPSNCEEDTIIIQLHPVKNK